MWNFILQEFIFVDIALYPPQKLKPAKFSFYSTVCTLRALIIEGVHGIRL